MLPAARGYMWSSAASLSIKLNAQAAAGQSVDVRAGDQPASSSTTESEEPTARLPSLNMKWILFAAIAVLSFLPSGWTECERALGIGSNLVEDIQISASSWLTGFSPHFGRLDADPKPDLGIFGSWCASFEDQSPFWQVDFRRSVILTAVAIQSPPKPLAGLVQSFSLSFSYDGSSWISYGFPTRKVFSGPNDSFPVAVHHLDTHMAVRYVRILPLTSRGQTCLRTEMYGCEYSADCSLPLGMEKRTIPDSALSASSALRNMFLPKFARLNEQLVYRKKMYGAWCPEENDFRPYLQIDLGWQVVVSSIATQGVLTITVFFASNYTLRYSYDGQLWYNYSHNQVFQANNDSKSIVLNNLTPQLYTRYLRIYPLNVFSRPCIRAEIYGCHPAEDCSRRVGVHSPDLIPDSALTSSSSLPNHFPYLGRVNNHVKKTNKGYIWGAWCPDRPDESPHLQVDMGSIRQVSGVETQGYPFPNAWVTKYNLSFSLDGYQWEPPMRGSSGRLFLGNSNNSSLKSTWLESPVLARYVRFMPVEKSGDLACMRVEVLECAPTPGSTPRMVSSQNQLVVQKPGIYQVACHHDAQPGSNVHLMLPSGQLIGARIVNQTSAGKGADHDSSGHNFPVTIHPWFSNWTTHVCIAQYSWAKVQAWLVVPLVITGPVPMLSLIGSSETSARITVVPSQSVGYQLVSRVQMSLQDSPTKVLWERLEVLPDGSPLVLTLDDLSPGQSYAVNGIFVFNDTQGWPSQQLVFTLEESVPSGPPMAVSALSMNSTCILLSWESPPLSQHNGLLISYEIHYLETSDQYRKGDLRTDQTQLTLCGLKPGTIYSFSVRCLNSAGAGPFSATATTRTQGSTSVPDSGSNSNITSALEILNSVGVSRANADFLADKVAALTSASASLAWKDIGLSTSILEKAVDLTSGPPIQFGKYLMATITNIMNASHAALRSSNQQDNSGPRLVAVLEKWLLNVNTSHDNLTMATDGIFLTKVQLLRGYLRSGINLTSPDGEGGVFIPGEAFGGPKTSLMGTENVYFTLFRKPDLFSRRDDVIEKCVDGFTRLEKRYSASVITSGVPGRIVANLTNNVVIQFRYHEDLDKIKSTMCMYWDFNRNGGLGDWSSNGCQLERIVNNTIVCLCNHLTNFAAIMDIHSDESKACGQHGTLLSLISRIGCFLSLLGLSGTIVTYFCSRRLRKEEASRILLNLCLSLLFLLIAFLVGSIKSLSPLVCQISAVLVHYFILSSFLWMFLEAFFMYRAFVIVFTSSRNYILKSCFLAWGVPTAVVTACAFSSWSEYGHKNYCLPHGAPFKFGILPVVVLVLLVNFILVAVIMVRLHRRQPPASQDETRSARFWVQARRLCGMTFITGLAWVFGVMMIWKTGVVFHYLFAIFNSMQGFYIFLFYCVTQLSVRQLWWDYICCLSGDRRFRSDGGISQRYNCSNTRVNNIGLQHAQINTIHASAPYLLPKDSDYYATLDPMQPLLGEQSSVSTLGAVNRQATMALAGRSSRDGLDMSHGRSSSAVPPPAGVATLESTPHSSRHEEPAPENRSLPRGSTGSNRPPSINRCRQSYRSLGSGSRPGWSANSPTLPSQQDPSLPGGSLRGQRPSHDYVGAQLDHTRDQTKIINWLDRGTFSDEDGFDEDDAIGNSVLQEEDESAGSQSSREYQTSVTSSTLTNITSDFSTVYSPSQAPYESGVGGSRFQSEHLSWAPNDRRSKRHSSRRRSKPRVQHVAEADGNTARTNGGVYSQSYRTLRVDVAVQADPDPSDSTVPLSSLERHASC